MGPGKGGSILIHLGTNNAEREDKTAKCRRMAIEMLVQHLCREEEVRFVDLWGCFVERADMYMRNGLHLSGNSAAVFADELSAAFDLFLVANIV